jgi:O-antigen ligase
MGFVSLVSLVVLLARPYKSSSLNVIASIVFLFGLFFSQSKTSWLSAIACVLFLGVTSYRQAFLRFIANPKTPLIGAGLVGLVLAVVVGMGFVFLFADLGRQFREFAATSEGASIVTLTERDVIWNVAFDEWARSPWLGYGSELFGVLHRLSIGMPHATSGHNQFVDTLARSGILGFSALVVYVACLAFWIFKYTRNNRVLPALLFLVLLLRCVTEVPLAMDGYSLEFFCHLLLLGAITAAHSEEKAALTQNLKIKTRYTQHTPSVDVQPAVVSVFAGSERV